MTEQLERLTSEVRKLTSVELYELRRWLADYQCEESSLDDADERRVAWSKHFQEVERYWGTPPLDKNIVMEMREEERS